MVDLTYASTSFRTAKNKTCLCVGNIGIQLYEYGCCPKSGTSSLPLGIHLCVCTGCSLRCAGLLPYRWLILYYVLTQTLAPIQTYNTACYGIPAGG